MNVPENQNHDDVNPVPTTAPMLVYEGIPLHRAEFCAITGPDQTGEGFEVIAGSNGLAANARAIVTVKAVGGAKIRAVRSLANPDGTPLGFVLDVQGVVEVSALASSLEYLAALLRSQIAESTGGPT